MIRKHKLASQRLRRVYSSSGWTVGQNVRVDYRWDRTNAAAMRNGSDLVALKPDVVLAHSSGRRQQCWRRAAPSQSYFALVADPVGAGYVESLARPGGNVTGFTNFDYAISGKWLELLKEIAPAVRRVAVLRDAGISAGPAQFSAIQIDAPSFGVDLRPVDVRDAAERAITVFAAEQNGGLIMTGSSSAALHRALIVDLAARHRLARGLQRALLCRQRWPGFLWARLCRPVPTGSRLHRPHPPGR